MRTIKAISLWQPWASLIAIGAKQHETRSWGTSHRGFMAIHAAKRWTAEERGACMLFKHNFAVTVADCLEYWPTVPLPLGAMLCVVRLVNVRQIGAWASELSVSERAFGNYAPGRYAWKLEVVKVFDAPIPAKGAQGLFNWECPVAL